LTNANPSLTRVCHTTLRTFKACCTFPCQQRESALVDWRTVNVSTLFRFLFPLIPTSPPHHHMLPFRSLFQILSPYVTSALPWSWFDFFLLGDNGETDPLLMMAHLLEIYCSSPFGHEGILVSFSNRSDPHQQPPSVIGLETVKASLRCCSNLIRALLHILSSPSSDPLFISFSSYQCALMMFEMILLLLLHVASSSHLSTEMEEISSSLFTLCYDLLTAISFSHLRQLRTQFQRFIDLKMIPLFFQKDIWKILYTARDLSALNQESTPKREIPKLPQVKEEKEKTKGREEKGKGKEEQAMAMAIVKEKKIKIMERNEDSLQHSISATKRRRQELIVPPPETSSTTTPIPLSPSAPLVPCPVDQTSSLSFTTADEEEGTDTASMTSSTMPEIGIIKSEPTKADSARSEKQRSSDVWKIDASTPGLLDKFDLSF
jgi:hypothetical protein